MKSGKMLSFQPKFFDFVYGLDSNIKPAIMSVTNLLDDKIAIKVKTNAPKEYMVKPNICVIDGKGSIQLFVTPHNGIKPEDPRVKTHKFLIESTIYPNDSPDIPSLFSSSKSLSKAKISVRFTKMVDEEIFESAVRIPAAEEPISPKIDSSPEELTPSLKTPIASPVQDSLPVESKKEEEKKTELTHILKNPHIESPIVKIAEEEKKPLSKEREESKEVRALKLNKEQQEKLDKLEQIYSQVEKEKAEFMSKLEKLQTKPKIVSATEAPKNIEGFSLFHVLIVALIALILGYILMRIY